MEFSFENCVGTLDLVLDSESFEEHNNDDNV